MDEDRVAGAIAATVSAMTVDISAPDRTRAFELFAKCSSGDNRSVDRPKIERLDPKERIVRQWPLKGLWDEDGVDLAVHPVRDLGASEIKEILQSGLPVPFVTTEHRWEWGGSRFKWIRGSDRFDFWKNEVQPHLADPETSRWSLEDFPDEYFYVATEWRWEGQDTPWCIVLRMFH